MYSYFADYIGLPGGYIDEIEQNLLLGVNGKGETFLYSLSENKFKSVQSNLNQLYKDQKFEDHAAQPGQFSVKDIF